MLSRGRPAVASGRPRVRLTWRLAAGSPAGGSALLLIAVCVGFAVVPTSQAVVGGQKVEMARSTSAVGLMDKNGRYVCAGVAVAPRWVATARHCLSGAGPFAVRAGAVVLSAATSRKVTEQVTAPATNGFQPDLALLRVDADLPVAPSRLAGADQRGVGTPVNLVGWGRIDKDTPYVDQLRELQAQLVADEQCPGLHAGSELCVADVRPPIGSACFGDSGGPAYVGGSDRVVLGITVRSGTTDHVCSGPVLYTDLTAHASWIEQTLRHP